MVRPVPSGTPIRAASTENGMPELTRKLRAVTAYRDAVGAIRTMLAGGADRNARNACQATALDIAMREGRVKAADALRDA